MRGRDRRVVARLGNPDADPFLRAEMDRRALLAEVDRLTAALATAARERDALGDAYREAIGVPESQHQRERMERIASAYEQAVAERDAAQARLAKVAKMRDLWRESAGEDRDMESKTIRAVAAYLDVALSDEGIGQ
ncbi:MAG TPA: hypothetical protein VJL80_10010 [Aeromicrobium sp.]|nr:hypothetical protein [Aeromicrobium sp.]